MESYPQGMAEMGGNILCMERRKWPYWLKGALFLFCFSFPIMWVNAALAFALYPLYMAWGGILYVVLRFEQIRDFSFLVVGLINGLDPSGIPINDTYWHLARGVSVLIYAIFGAMCGWFYGLVKTKKLTVTQLGKTADSDL